MDWDGSGRATFSAPLWRQEPCGLWEKRAEAIAGRLAVLEAAAWADEEPLFEAPAELPPYDLGACVLEELVLA